MSTGTIVYVNGAYVEAPNRRRRACGLCSTQKKRCVPVSQCPLLCENCKKRNLKDCPAPCSRKGVLAEYLALTGQLEEKDESIAVQHLKAKANGCLPDRFICPDRPEPIPGSLVSPTSGHQTTQQTSTDANSQQQDDSNTKSHIDRFYAQPTPGGPGNSADELEAAELYSGSSVDPQPQTRARAHGSFGLDSWIPSSVSQSNSSPWPDTPEQDLLSPVVSENIPTDNLVDDLAHWQAFCRLFEIDNGVHSAFQNLTAATHALPYYDAFYQTPSPYPQLPYFDMTEGDEAPIARAPILTRTSSNLRPFEIDDSFEEVVRQLQSIQCFPD